MVAAAVILPPGTRIDGVDDSKRLTPAGREELDAVIRARAMAVGVGLVDAATIDRVNVLEATRRADRKSTRLNSSHIQKSRMPSSA